MKRDDLEPVVDDESSWAYWQAAKKKKEQKQSTRKQKEQKIQEFRNNIMHARERITHNHTPLSPVLPVPHVQEHCSVLHEIEDSFRRAACYLKGSRAWALALVNREYNPPKNQSEARDIYLELAKKWHPDRGGSHHAMAALNLAWDVLDNEQK